MREFWWRRLADATCVTVRDEKNEASSHVCLVCVCVIYDRSRRWWAIGTEWKRDYNELIWCATASPWFTAQRAAKNRLINKLTNWGLVRLTGDSGTWSSSREKELLNALNVSLFCLCRSIVARITCDRKKMTRTEERGFQSRKKDGRDKQDKCLITAL